MFPFPMFQMPGEVVVIAGNSFWIPTHENVGLRSQGPTQQSLLASKPLLSTMSELEAFNYFPKDDLGEGTSYGTCLKLFDSEEITLGGPRLSFRRRPLH